MNILDWLPRWIAEDISFGTNTFTDLVIVLALLFVVFFTQHHLRHRKVQHARRRMPLVIGGWGTRGKSGTERCKAALFHGYGAQVYSKTSGCEAMFIHCPPGETPRELFLFRPMEKVSIWEMAGTLRNAADLDARIYLYECMALNPRYVQVIQHGWMRDDIATITNAYPDHEDIQGPAGHDVAATISQFLPHHGEAFTTEEHMFPILNERARVLETSLQMVPWIDQALLTNDVMRRFPYREHPANIALVQTLGRQLGIDDTFILKEMADHIVPDLGVLRSYPAVAWAGRCMIFTNGMSANERRGALENWRRLGLFEHRCAQQPGEWQIGVINNRADRIARSRVFAKVAISDQPAHRYLCIGSNLTGLRAYLDEALDLHESHWSLSDCLDENAALARLDEHCEEIKWEVRDEQTFLTKVDILLRGFGCNGDQREQLLARGIWNNLAQAAADVDGTDTIARCAAAWTTHRASLMELLNDQLRTDETVAPIDRVAVDEVGLWIGRYWQELRLSNTLRRAIRDAMRHDRPLAELEPAYRAVMRGRSLARFSFVDDYHAPGDAVIDAAFHLLPPGHRAQLVGLQNIKGTGLDFAYRWIDIMETAQICQRLTGDNDRERLAAAEQLVAGTGWHVQDARMALAAVQRMREDPRGQQRELAPLLQRAEDSLRAGLEQALGRMTAGHQRHRSDAVFEIIEALIDFGDSIRRRMRYGRIINDLIAERISHRRAAEELRGITARQKGGWMLKFIARWRARAESDDEAQTLGADALRGRIYDAQAFDDDLSQVALYAPQEAR